MKFVHLFLLTTLFSVGPSAVAQRTDYRDLLLFGEAWIGPSDYVWSRESTSRLANDRSPGARVRDVGRLRVRFISLEEELLGLDLRILNYRFETEIRGGGLSTGISDLEGTRLPPVWLHSALGFSVDSEPGSGLHSNLQAGELFDLLDFRGFVPREAPIVGEEWTGKTVRKPDDRYRFREERERRFTCKSKEATETGEKFEVEFSELLKVTSLAAGRTNEIRETRGTYWVILPAGLVEAASWESVSSEFTSDRDNRGVSDKIETVTKVHIARRDPPPPRSRKSEENAKAAPEEPPLPPR